MTSSDPPPPPDGAYIPDRDYVRPLEVTSSDSPPPLAGAPPPEEVPPLGAGIDFTDPNSPLAPYYLRASHLVAVALLGGIVILYSWFPLWHTDIWGHLKFGQWIVEHRELPEREPLCEFAD